MVDNFFLSAEGMMNGVVFHTDITDKLPYVAELLFNNNANAIIVRQGGIPIGIITSKDIVKALLTIEKDPDQIMAREIMSYPIVTVDHNKDVTFAREIMLSKGVQKLPVVKDFDVIGLMVQSDLLKNASWTTKL